MQLINFWHSIANDCAEALEGPSAQVLDPQALSDLGVATLKMLQFVPIYERGEYFERALDRLLFEDVRVGKDLGQQIGDLGDLIDAKPVFDPSAELHLCHSFLLVAFDDLLIKDLQRAHQKANVDLLMLNLLRLLRESN